MRSQVDYRGETYRWSCVRPTLPGSSVWHPEVRSARSSGVLGGEVRESTSRSRLSVVLTARPTTWRRSVGSTAERGSGSAGSVMDATGFGVGEAVRRIAHRVWATSRTGSAAVRSPRIRCRQHTTLRARGDARGDLGTIGRGPVLHREECLGDRAERLVGDHGSGGIIRRRQGCAPRPGHREPERTPRRRPVGFARIGPVLGAIVS